MEEDAVRQHLLEHQQVMAQVVDALSPTIAAVACSISDALAKGGKLLIFGNGGSAADAQHFAAELVGRFLMERRALPAIALTTDTSILTAVGNDYGFDAVFERQVEALAQPGDVAFGISTSGNSENVLRALRLARGKDCLTVGLIGRDGGKIAGFVDMEMTIPSKATPRIQEAHSTIIHILCDLIEKRLFPGE
jgi:D-sedoheptulose 7-phosphate isomerase